MPLARRSKLLYIKMLLLTPLPLPEPRLHHSIGAVCSGNYVLGLVGATVMAHGLSTYAFGCTQGYDAVSMGQGPTSATVVVSGG